MADATVGGRGTGKSPHCCANKPDNSNPGETRAEYPNAARPCRSSAENRENRENREDERIDKAGGGRVNYGLRIHRKG
jgi:hypothetical protein